MPPTNKGTLGAALRLVGLGWYVSICIVAGILGGRFLDEKVFHTSFLFTLLGLGVGLGLAFWGLYKILATVLADTSNSNNLEA